MALSHVEFYAEVDAAGVANPTLNIPSVSWGAGDRIFVWIGCRDSSNPPVVAGVTATGLTFTEELIQDEATQHIVWGALFFSDLATAPGTQTVTVSITAASFTGGLQASVIVVSGDHPTLDAAVGAETGATDTNNPSVDVLTQHDVARIFYAFQVRQRTFVVDVADGLTQIRLDDFVGTGGNIAGEDLFYKDVSSIGTYNGSGIISAATDWVAIGWSVYEAGPPPISPLTHTEYYFERNAVGEVDPVVKIPISWEVGDNILIFISGRDDDAIVTSMSDVTGEVINPPDNIVSQDESVQQQVWIEAWGLLGGPTTTRGVNATLDINLTATSFAGGIQVEVLVFSGDSPNFNVGDAAGAETGASDTTVVDISTSATSLPSRVYFGVQHRDVTSFTLTPAFNLTSIRNNDQIGSGAEAAGFSSFWREGSDGSEGGGTLNPASDWVAVGLEVFEGNPTGNRLDAKWFNFTKRRQVWDHFWQDANLVATTTVSTFSLDAELLGGTIFGNFTLNAVLLKTQTASFTLDSIIKREQTASFTLDAIIKRTISGSFTLDAVLLRTQSATFTLDAVLLRTQTASFTLDAVILRTQTATFTLDAVLFKTQTATFTFDAVLLRTQSASFALDAVLKREQTASFVLDAILLRTTTATFTLDAVIKREQLASLTLDAVLFKSQSATFTLDAQLAITITQVATLEAVIFKTTSVNVTLDAVLYKLQTASFTFDAVLKREQSATFTFDAILLRTQTATFTLDATIFKTQSASYTLDAVIYREQTATFTLDAVLRITSSATFTLDAWLLRTQTATFTLDAVLFRTQTATYTLDAVIMPVFTLDAIVLRTQTASFTLNAVLMPSFTLDSIFKREQSASFTLNAFIPGDNTYAVTLDAVLFRTVTSTFSTDALVSRTFAATLSLDAIILRVQTASFTLDAVQLKTSAATVTADAVLKATRTVGFTLDAVLLTLQSASRTLDAVLFRTTTASYTLDAYLIVSSAGAFTLDAALNRTSSATFALDASLNRTSSATFALDAQLVRVGTGSFTLDSTIKVANPTFTLDAVITIGEIAEVEPISADCAADTFSAVVSGGFVHAVCGADLFTWSPSEDSLTGEAEADTLGVK